MPVYSGKEHCIQHWTTRDSVTTIGDWAFYGCEGLTAVAIPASVTDLGEGVFYYCTSLTAITVDAENSVYSSLDGVLFDKAQTELICCPAGKTGAYAVPDTVIIIAESAFEGCAGLTSVTIPDSVATIDAYAFCGCTGLTTIIMGSGVTTIGEDAFDGCESLTDVYYAGSAEDWAAIDIGSGNDCLTDAAIHYGTTILASGTCGDNATYTLTSDGVLTISGTGAIDRVAFEGNTDIVTVVIEDGITSIGNWAFGDCTSLTTVTIPASVTSIGYAAFAYCTGLTDVTISDGVLSIGDYVFYECVGLTAVTIPASVTTIGSYAFVNCTGLTTMIIPAGVTSIGEGVFFGCRSLADITVDEENSAYISLDGVLFNKEQTELICYPAGKAGAYVIPDSVTTISIGAFGCCAGLTAVTIPDSVTTIGDYVFDECTGLTAVTIPASVTTIGDYIFYFCISLTDITVDEENSVYSSLNGVLFNKDQTELICCPAGKAGKYVVPDSVTSIAGYAFEECNSLTAVIIPASVTSIGEGAFESCDSLTDITVDGENTAYASLDGVLLSKDQTELVCYPAGKAGAYAVPDTVTAIGDYAFYDCSGLTSMTMGSGVTAIGEGAFYGCGSLTDVYYAGSAEDWAAIAIGSDNECLTDATIHYGTIDGEGTGILASGTCGDSLTWTLDSDYVLTISGTGAMTDWDSSSDVPWYSCRSDITAVTIGEGVTSIGDYAFYRCTGLTAVTIPASVTDIGAVVFYGCTSLTAVTIPAGVTAIGAMTFYGCTSLTAVTIPDSVTAIGEAAFAYCAGLSGVTIPDSVTTIDDWAFYGCESLTAVTIPASVTTMGDYVFVLCTSLTAITVDGENSAYSSLDGVLFNKEQTELICYPGGKTGDYVIPDGVTTITGYAFYGCSGLTAVTVPASVTDIGECAFERCDSLTCITVDGENSVYSSLDGVLFNKEQTELLRYPGGRTGDYVIPDTVTTVGDSAFAYCAGLTAVTIPDSITTIDGWAFYGCTGLTAVTIPASVTAIGECVFDACTSLTDITVDGENSAYSSLDGVLFNKAQTELLCYPAGRTGAYAIPNTVTTIGEDAFSSCAGLTDVTIPDSVTTISDYAFYDCTGLTALAIPASVTAIGYEAFYGCENLTDVYYAGSAEDWAAIDIDSDNECLTEADLHFCTVTVTEPTCTKDGSMTYTCEDGDSYTVVLPATGHNYENGVCTECGAKEPGAGGSGWHSPDKLSTFLTNMMNRVFTMLNKLFARFW